MSDKKITIALDGFSSSGKSSMAKWLAKQIGYVYADSGAMYRAVTLFCLQNNLIVNDVIDEEGLKKQIGNIRISFSTNAENGLQETYLNDVNVEKEIRTLLISNYVSPVSTLKFVREALVRQQQEMGQKKGIVMDGRDIGTVVFPNAELKIFVTATPEVRAERRFLEMQEKGDAVAYEDILENVKKRDYIDQNRAESPLRKADDAIVLDNSHLTIDEQREWLLKQFEEKTR
ncbi:MAG: (d)CMP kinase [Prevotellaceae bacterium]|jgi:cytidylate kinase|nr:(d)CMP kinase [Prevotellaceae bacterium]